LLRQLFFLVLATVGAKASQRFAAGMQMTGN
jgi:hypothetical protein